MDNMIAQRYMETYNRRNQAVGVFIGLLDKEVIRTSWSRVNLHKGDKFDMNKGIIEAIKNMASGKEIPCMSNLRKFEDFYANYEHFRNRCLRYFQGHELEGKTPSIDLSSMEGMFGKGVKDIMGQFLKAGIPLAEQLQRQGIMGIGIPVGVGMGSMGFGSSLAQMLKLIDINGNDMNHPETLKTPEVKQTTSPTFAPAPDDDDIVRSVYGPITACDDCNGRKGKECPVMGFVDGICNKQ